MLTETLPEFFLIGASKAGTTSLFDALRQHPDFYGPEAKEPHFFDKDDRFARGIDWYIHQYYSRTEKYKIRADGTPTYLTQSTKVAPRLSAVYKNKNPKFGVIFRDPIQRAYSGYWQNVKEGKEKTPFENVIQRELAEIKHNRLTNTTQTGSGYLYTSCYANRIKPFLELFPRQSFNFMLQEDLIAHFDETTINLLAFLDLKPTHLSEQHSNSSGMPINKFVYPVRNFIKKTPVASWYRAVIPASQRKKVGNFLIRPHQYPPMDVRLKQELRDFLTPEIQELEQLIKRDLSKWYLP